MVQDSSDTGLRPIDFENIYSDIPILQDLAVRLDYVSMKSIKDSSDLDVEDWKKTAGIIQKKYEQYAGFVIMHGTDTMAYTASALSFMLENLDKPVIITGSQIPIRMLRSDGRDNLINAIEIAAELKPDGSPMIQEVCVSFHDKLFRGNRSVKDSSDFFNAFTSPSFPCLAESGINIVYNEGVLITASNQKFTVFEHLNTNVILIKLFPGMQSHLYTSILENKRIRGLVLESYGTGNTPSAKWFLDLMKSAYDNEVVVLNVSQCASGNVRSGLYEVSNELKALGVVDGKQMTTEAGITKLMYLLGKYPNDTKKIRQELQNNLRGEI